MPIITITFEHQQAKPPKYTFGDHIAVKDDGAPKDWLTGEIVGLTLEQEVFKPCWWYSIKLAFPPGYTEEYQEDELVLATEMQEQLLQEKAPSSLPKFQPGARVKLNAESGFNNLIRDFAIVVSSKYISNEYWSGWTYKLTSKDLTKPIEIGEVWLELAPSTAPSSAVKQPSGTS